MVKGDGYGHGAAEVAACALTAGAEWLGVSMVEEGLALRDAGITAPILITTELAGGSETVALQSNLTPAVYTVEAVQRLTRAAAALHVIPAVHVKVDTGLQRVGAAPAQVPGLIARLAASHLTVQGLWTHLAVSDELDNPFTLEQLNRLRTVVEYARAAGQSVPLVHAANTAAVMAWPQAHFDMVRPGIGIVGCSPNSALPGSSSLRPALTFRSEVAYTKRVRSGDGVSYGLTYRPPADTVIATVPVGFADGYPRALSNRGAVLINGRRCPIAGIIAMDQLLVDCGDQPVQPGSEVVLIGRQGDQEITAVEVAATASTIPDEIFCGLNPRVPRDYLN